MTGDEMIKNAVVLFGEPGHITALASKLGVDRTQIWRWAKLKEIPGPAAAAIQCWIDTKKPGHS